MNTHAFAEGKEKMLIVTNWTRTATKILSVIILLMLFISPTLKNVANYGNHLLNPIVSDVDIDHVEYDNHGAKARWHFYKHKALKCALIADNLAYYDADKSRHAILAFEGGAPHTRPAGPQKSTIWVLPHVTDVCKINIWTHHRCEVPNKFTDNGVPYTVKRETHFWNPLKSQYCEGKL